MTTAYERTRALISTREMLKRLQDPGQTRRVPGWLRAEAAGLLQHYPTYEQIEQVHQALPDSYGPVPPFSRLSGTADVQGVIDATKPDVPAAPALPG